MKNIECSFASFACACNVMRQGAVQRCNCLHVQMKALSTLQHMISTTVGRS